ncbi:isoprenylcysteine carboxyl methyltransferase family protein [Dongia deserti]|uniref:isoprenylcysteine carboxyl methyltransferase family protein n=1 Tax=Dongia deserti TaxID=2268030 RepID=UPI000E65513A|nr:isoprenylcysteine carboxylmethyltransferase family protein [Dongia deserti]
MTEDQLFCAGLLLLVTLQRLIELVIASRNTRALLAEGAYEIGRGHYPAIVFLHTAWLAVLWAFVLFGLTLFQVWAAIAYLTVLGLRIWTMASLGRYWTTRIIVVPHAPLVRAGPYRFLRHPNYLVVVLEIALLPLALGSWPLALGFTVVNVILLAWRIKVENSALASRR